MSVLGRIFQTSRGTVEVLGFDATRIADTWRRRERFTPVNGAPPVERASFAASAADDSPPFTGTAVPACSCCGLGMLHTMAHHRANLAADRARAASVTASVPPSHRL